MNSPEKESTISPAKELVETNLTREAKHQHHFGTDHLLTNLKGRVVSSGVVTGVAQVVKFGLYIISTVALSRLLSHEDFGLVAMVGTASIFLRMFREAGLSTATVQKEQITHAQVSNLFWINVLLGAVAAGVGSALAPLLAWFYRDQRLIPITIGLSLTFLVSGWSIQHTALLNRQMRFKAIALVDIGSSTLGLIVGVVMAMLGYRYWSLVGSQMATALAEVALVWCASRWRPQWPSRRSGTRTMLNFGASLTFASILRKVSNASDGLLLGRFYGAGALGLYTRGMALLMRPLDQFLAPFDMVFVPVLSRLQDQPVRYRNTFLQVYNGLALVSFPVAGLFLGLSQPLVLFCLGPKWLEVVPIFAALTLAALFYPVAGASMWLLTTQGRNKDIMVAGLIISCVSVGSYLLALPFGATGMALAFSLSGLFIRLPIQYYIVGRTGPVSTKDLWIVFVKHLPIWFVVSGITFVTRLAVSTMPSFAQLCICAFVGLLACAGLIFGLPSHRREVFVLINMVKELKLKKKSG